MEGVEGGIGSGSLRGATNGGLAEEANCAVQLVGILVFAVELVLAGVFRRTFSRDLNEKCVAVALGEDTDDEQAVELVKTDDVEVALALPRELLVI